MTDGMEFLDDNVLYSAAFLSSWEKYKEQISGLVGPEMAESTG